MRPLKVVLFAQFLQMLIQAQNLIIFKHLNMEFASYFDFGELQSLFFYEARKNSKYVFELMVNVLMLHDY
jgi:hypothetical protein